MSGMTLRNILVRHRPSIRAEPFSARRTAIYAPGGVQYKSLFNDWKGSSTEDHSTKRSKNWDTNEPTSDAAASGMKERERNEGIADDTKSAGMTERGGRKESREAKQEHPEAPEPIIGMNDERAQVSTHAETRVFSFRAHGADDM